MIRRLLLIGLLLLLPLQGIPATHAQDVDTPQCTEQTYNALAHEKRVYRSVLFGQKKSEDLPSGSVRYDTEGNAWMKMGTNRWNSLSKGYEHTTWSDMLMDDRADAAERRGIFEIRTTPTSDLIPAITQAFRAYQCHLMAVCMAAEQSQSAGKDQKTVKVQPDGCIEFEEPVLDSCKDNTQATAGAGTCDGIVASMLDEEQRELVMLVSYDASYRSLLQFQGVFEGFLQDFRFPLIEPLWQTVRSMGSLMHIPCFIGQCDE